MQVKGKSIRAITKLLAAAQGCDEIKLAHKVTENISDIGFDKNPSIGDYLIPKPIGKTTSLNANGKQIIRKDLPLQPQPRSYFTTWKDWHGQEHSGIQARDIDMYPREYLPAQEEELYVIEIDGTKYIATDKMLLTDENEVRNIHLSNLMLECFGSFEIFDTNKKSIVTTKLKQLHWDILPPGEYPWSRAKPLIGEITKNLKESDRKVVESRMQLISRFTPDFLATGRAGFSGYFVYGFTKKGIYILESIHLDNATYVFGDDWERLSKLTKNQIINGEIDHQRIIHDKKWNRSINLLLRN